MNSREPIEKNDLGALWADALVYLAPERLFLQSAPAEASLFWGKAAASTALVRARFEDPSHFFVIAPATADPREIRRLRLLGAQVALGEHPLPGGGSFAAGEKLAEFFRFLGERGIRTLAVFLSGGASSLAWIRPYGISESELSRRLSRLYQLPLSIERLNEERSRLCALKGGGAARLLHLLAPSISVRVDLLSDVAPYGPQVVGSGPFWDGQVPHRTVADSRSLALAVSGVARRRGERVLGCHALPPGWSWADWAGRIFEDTLRALSAGRPGLLIYSGEPVVSLAQAPRAGSGGRQTQLACALSALLPRQLARCEVEFLCGASDGQDGASGSAGAVVNAQTVVRAGGLCNFQQDVEKGARTLSSAQVLAPWGALLPLRLTGTNLQDCVLVRIHPR